MSAAVEKDVDSQDSRKRCPNSLGRYPRSPLGATPRPPLPQKYNLTPARPRSSTGTQKTAIKVNGTNGKETDHFTSIKPKSENGQLTPTADIDLDGGSSTWEITLVALIFLAAIVSLGFVYLHFPKLEAEEKQHIKVPTDIEDAKNLGRVLSRYKDKYYFQVLGGYFITYIFLQSFAIPGSIFLSMLSGFLFPFPLALSLVCLCSALGASFCYLLSYLVGRRLVQNYIPERVAEWSQHVQRHREHLLNYIIFLRITPFLPNWFINITSPVISVPLFPFCMGTFIGVAPPSFVAIQAGTTLHQLTSSGDAVSMTSIAVLGVLAGLSLLPVFFKKKLQEKYD